MEQPYETPSPVTPSGAPVSPGATSDTHDAVLVIFAAAPVTPDDPLVTPGSVLVTSDAAPLTSVDALVIHGDTQVTSGDAPIASSTALATSAVAPVTSATASVTPSDAPVTLGAASVTPVVALVIPGATPLTPVTAQVTLSHAPVTPGTAPVTTGDAPATFGAAPVTSAVALVTPGATPVTSATAPVTPGDAPVILGAAPVTYTSAPLAFGATLVTPGSASVTPFTAPVTFDAISVTHCVPQIIPSDPPIPSDATPVIPGASPVTLVGSPVTNSTTSVTTSTEPVSSGITQVYPSATQVTTRAASLTLSAALVTSDNTQVSPNATLVSSSVASVTVTAAPVTSGNTLGFSSATPVTTSAASVSPPDRNFTYSEGVYRLKNARLYQEAIPLAFRSVLKWAWKNKDANQSYFDSIKNLKTKNYLKKVFYSSEIVMLEDKTPENFDSTLLYKLIVFATEEFSTVVAASPSWISLNKLLKQCKDKRNSAAHDVTIAVSKFYFSDVKPLLLDLLDKAADLFAVTLNEKKTGTNELEIMLDEIDQGKPADKNLLDIRMKFLREGKEEMKTRWEKFSKSKLLFSSDLEVEVETVYNKVRLKNWDDVSTGTAGCIGMKFFEAELIFGEWPGKSNKNIKLLSGDAGSGKTFLTRVVFLSWLGLINVKFDQLDNYDLLLYMQCRNDRHESLKELIRENYPHTCFGLKMKEVVNSFMLPGSRILYVVDGADERNVRSNRLLEDILEHFGPETTNVCLITSRPHEVDSVKRLLDENRLSYQCCNITELTEDRQIESLERYQTAVNQSSACTASPSTAPLQTTSSFESQSRPNVVESFKRIDIKTVFHHPLNLVYFFELYLKMPEKVLTWTGEADIMDAMYNLYIQVTVQKLERSNSGVVNLDTIVQKAFTKLGNYSLELFQDENYRLTEDQHKKLRDICFENVSHNIDYKKLFSNVLLCEKDAYGRETGIYNFPHRSTQEHLQAMAIIASWEKHCRKAAEEERTEEEGGLIAETLVKMIQIYKRISGAGATGSQKTLSTQKPTKIEHVISLLTRQLRAFTRQRTQEHFTIESSDFRRYEKTIQFIILELLRTRRPHTDGNIISLTGLQHRLGVRRFEYWAGLATVSRFNPVVVHEAAAAVDTEEWSIDIGEVQAADVILIKMKQRKLKPPARVFVDIPRDVETPDTVSSFLRTVGGLGGKIKLSLQFIEAMEKFVPCDSLLKKLNNRRVLKYFLGCLSTPGNVLAPLITRGSSLNLALTNPDHDLYRMKEGWVDVLNVMLKCSTLTPSEPSINLCPLPRCRVNTIRLLDVPAGDINWPLKCLKALEPDKRGYDVVGLIRCGLLDAELDDLRQRVVQTVPVSSKEGISLWSPIDRPVQGWSTHSWGIVRDWSEDTVGRDIYL